MNLIKYAALVIGILLSMAQPVLGVVRISNMNDFNFGSWPGSGDLVSTDSVCMHNTAGNRYRIRAYGQGAGSAFEMTDGSQTLPYTVEIQGSRGGFKTLQPTRRTNFRRSDRTSSTCSGGTNATLRITLLETDLQTLFAGTYTGTITLIIAP